MGWGLIALGAVLGVLAVLWIVTTALSAGAVVLGLMLGAILALPPIGAGSYILRRSRQEEAETTEFVGRRRVLEQDRLFRARIASEARQQAERLDTPGRGEPRLERAAARLRQVADQLQGPGYDQAAWYEAVKLADADVEALGQYDNVISERLRGIATQVDALELGDQPNPAELLRTVQAWERELDRRLELLRGERAPSVAPSELLAAGEPARGAEAIAALTWGDAVTYEEDDYLVELTVTYFASGRTWKLHRLGGAETQERWLYVAPGGLSQAWLRRSAPPADVGAAEVRVDGTSHRLADQGTASVTVTGPDERSERLAIDYWHYEGPSGALYWQERWPDGARAYQGAPIPARTLEVWPRERTPTE